jgi:hypothetical protein
MKKSIAIAAVLLPLLSFAHGGHGHGHGHEPFHFLASPSHFIPMILAAVVVIGYFSYRRKQQENA